MDSSDRVEINVTTESVTGLETTLCEGKIKQTPLVQLL